MQVCPTVSDGPNLSVPKAGELEPLVTLLAASRATGHERSAPLVRSRLLVGIRLCQACRGLGNCAPQARA